jgi:hypothetical protein
MSYILLCASCFILTVFLPAGDKFLLADWALLAPSELKKVTIIFRVLDVTDDKMSVEKQ